MENKRIYIDGVNVSGCDFLAKEDDYCSYSGEYRAYKGQCGCSDEEMCKDHPNCFYKKVLKQLKAKEQECEELKRLYKELQDDMLACNKCRATIKLQQQLDQLKAQLLDQEAETLKAGGIIYKLEQTITEIKKIAKKSCCLQATSTCEEYENCKECNKTNDEETIKQILQKISEWEAENEI